MVAAEEPHYDVDRLDSYVARMLSQEPVEIQRAIIGILTILKSVAKTMPKESTDKEN